jgi:Glycosyl transferase family 2
VNNQTNRKVILCCPTRNEASNLKRMIPSWSTFTDHIIIADQNSNDDTKVIAAQFEKVILINNSDNDYNETNRIKLLVEKAREISDSAILLFLDADETLSGNVLDSPEWKIFCQSQPGTAGGFLWTQLWKSPWQYIASGYNAPQYMRFAFIDDGRPIGNTAVMHGPRGVGVDNPKATFFFNDVVCLHFPFVNFSRHIKKQNWYKAWWLTKGGKYYHTNRNHNWYHFIETKNLSPIKPDWILPYSKLGIDITSVEINDIEWYDVEILRYFAKYGYKKFHLLDIWDEENWEHLRNLAIKYGFEGIPESPVEEPSFVFKMYMRLTEGRISLGTVINKLTRYLIRTILP